MRHSSCSIRAWGCVFGVFVMQIVVFALVLGFPQTTSCLRKCAQEAKKQTEYVAFRWVAGHIRIRRASRTPRPS